MPDWIKTVLGYGGTVVKAFHQGETLKLLQEPEDSSAGVKPPAAAANNLAATARNPMPAAAEPVATNRGGVCAALTVYWLHYRATSKKGFWEWADSKLGIAAIAELHDQADQDQYEDMLKSSRLFSSVTSGNRHKFNGNIDEVDLILSTIVAHDGYHVLSLKKTKQRGHALGFHVDTSGTLHFMDPNEGEAYFDEEHHSSPIADPEKWNMTTLCEEFGIPKDKHDPRYQVAYAQITRRESLIEGWADTMPATLPSSPLVRRLAIDPKNVPNVTLWFEVYLRKTRYSTIYDGFVIRTFK